MQHELPSAPGILDSKSSVAEVPLRKNVPAAAVINPAAYGDPHWPLAPLDATRCPALLPQQAERSSRQMCSEECCKARREPSECRGTGLSCQSESPRDDPIVVAKR